MNEILEKLEIRKQLWLDTYFSVIKKKLYRICMLIVFINLDYSTPYCRFLEPKDDLMKIIKCKGSWCKIK